MLLCVSESVCIPSCVTRSSPLPLEDDYELPLFDLEEEMFIQLRGTWRLQRGYVYSTYDISSNSKIKNCQRNQQTDPSVLGANG